MGVEKSDLRHYTPPDGPDLSLAILIHATCQQLHHFKDPSWPSDKFSKVLRAASKFKVQEASSQLQNGFCSLWNLLVGKAQDDEDGDGRKIARFILRPIYKVYVDIHQRSYPAAGTQFFARTHARTSEVADILRNPREYLPCTNETHQLDLIPEGNNDTALITFAHIRVAAPAHSASESTPALPLAITAPRASSAMSLKTEPDAAAEDDGKSMPALR
jgi:hypothetical protein